MAVNTVAVADKTGGPAASSSPAWLRALGRPWTLTGVVIVVLFCVIGVLGRYIAPYDPSAVSNTTLAGPSGAHWLGTTQTGQDVLSQMLYGTQTSMVVGVSAAIIATLFAVLVGLLSGYLGGVA